MPAPVPRAAPAVPHSAVPAAPPVLPVAMYMARAHVAAYKSNVALTASPGLKMAMLRGLAGKLGVADRALDTVRPAAPGMDWAAEGDRLLALAHRH